MTRYARKLQKITGGVLKIQWRLIKHSIKIIWRRLTYNHTNVCTLILLRYLLEKSFKILFVQPLQDRSAIVVGPNKAVITGTNYLCVLWSSNNSFGILNPISFKALSIIVFSVSPLCERI